MRSIISGIVLLTFLTFFAVSHASAPSCRTNDSGNSYCKYIGEVEKLYINSENRILVYFEDTLDLDEARKFGFDVSYDKAAALNITDDNRVFADLLYKTLLEAVAHDLDI